MRGRGVGRNVQCLGRVGRAGRTAANVCSRWVRGRLKYPESEPSWLRTSARAVGKNAEAVKLLGMGKLRSWEKSVIFRN